VRSAWAAWAAWEAAVPCGPTAGVAVFAAPVHGTLGHLPLNGQMLVAAGF